MNITSCSLAAAQLPRLVRRSRHRLAIGAAGLALAFAAALPAGQALAQSRIMADNLPTLGDPTVDDLSPLAEKKLGEAIWKDLQRQGVVFDDADLQDYLDGLGEKLLRAAQRLRQADDELKLRLFPVADATLNAFALPGGNIGVHTGLIATTGSEAELASVLAHEIGHVTQRHVARMVSRTKQTSMLMMGALVLAMLAAGSSPNGAQGMMALSTTMMAQDQMAFSRDAEREADRIGLAILQDAGFEPQAMMAMFQRLQQATRVYESNVMPAYLRSHPVNVERIADVQSRLRDLGGDVRANAASVRSPLGPLMFSGGLEFSLAQAKAQVMLQPQIEGWSQQRQRFLVALEAPQTTVSEIALRYGLAWLSLKLNDSERAQAELGQLRRLWPNGHPAFERLNLALLAQQKRFGQQLVDAKAATERFPTSMSLQRELAHAYLANQQAAAAVKLLRAQVRLANDRPDLWHDLAQALQANGQMAGQHAALAEKYFLTGATQAAVDQLVMAQNLPSNDHAEAAMIAARLIELKQIRRQEIDEERRR